MTLHPKSDLVKCFFTRAWGWASPWHEKKSTLETGLAGHLLPSD